MQAFSYHGYRFPPAIIQHAVWSYLRFTLSFRDVEDLLAERGITVSHETIRRWVVHFGPIYACRLRARRPPSTGRWHLDEVFVSIAGRRVYLWRAVDDEGEVLDILVQSRRDKNAALRLMCKLLKRQGLLPTSIVTDRYCRYGSALRDLGLSHLHRRGKRLNNRAESSHVPIRRGIGATFSFQSLGRLQHIQHLSPSNYSLHASDLERRGIPRLDDGRGRHRLTQCAALPDIRRGVINVTGPSGGVAFSISTRSSISIARPTFIKRFRVVAWLKHVATGRNVFMIVAACADTEHPPQVWLEAAATPVESAQGPELRRARRASDRHASTADRAADAVFACLRRETRDQGLPTPADRHRVRASPRRRTAV